MINKKYILTALLVSAAACAVQAQRQTVTDNHGRQMVVMIPAAKPDEDGLEVEYSDAKYYSNEASWNYYSDHAVETETEAAVLDRRIRRLPGTMQLTYNDEVGKHIDRYVKAGRHSTGCILGRAQYYNRFFEDALRTYGLPLELKYLPVIESGLNPNATSRVGAVGLWQFMPTTGRQYDLRIDSYVDERRDPVKSSYAAARFLSDLYQRFGDWTLALAAYNCGPTRVSNAIEKARLDNGDCDFWQVYQYLPKETRGYVPAFIAANYVMTYYGDYGIEPTSTGLPQRVEPVKITEDVSLGRIADMMGISVENLKMLNPQYRQGIVKTSNGCASLLLPADEASRFIKCSELLRQPCPASPSIPEEITAQTVGQDVSQNNSGNTFSLQ